jgi:AAA+ ATPase superfamily predicted ATPase
MILFVALNVIHKICCIKYEIVISLLKEEIMNPFLLQYHSGNFCDRVEEIGKLYDNVSNGINTVVYSPRRIGKTAMIMHFFHQLERSREYDTIYVDLFATRNLEDLINKLANEILNKYYKKNILDGIKTALKGLHANLSFSDDGIPQLSIGIGQGKTQQTLEKLFSYLENRNKSVVLAFDEFQEIAKYPEKADASLRTIIQHLHNVHCIYSGSTMHMLTDMFFSPSKPFYQSSDSLVVKKIDYDVYLEFIINQFSKGGKKITKPAAKYLLDFTEHYTFYTQMICNLAFYKSDNRLELNEAKSIVKHFLESRKLDYYNIYNLLSENQKRVLIAIAKEDKITKPTSIDFLMKHRLPSASSTLQAVNALVDKEILYKKLGQFTVYDVFLKRFVQTYL